MNVVTRSFHRKLLLKVIIFFMPLFIIAICILTILTVIESQNNIENPGVSFGNANVSASVLTWKPTVEKYASQFGMTQYVNLILAVMMQESGGNYVDLMQAAEGPYNTKYPKIPNGITDPDYSIACGIQELKLNFTEAGVKDGNDSQNINLGLQAYNFGTGYISFAKSNGGYSLENAKEFSAKEAVIYGYSNYGDVNYVPHVLRYYNVTNIATGSGDLGNIVSIAQQQEGKPYVWGAAGPSSFDCSGLVYYCYVNSGYKIQRETAQDYYNMSTKTTTPVAGDLVFFGTPGNIYHIGIYSGNGQMINAPKTGDVVKVASVSRSDFAGYGHLNK